jgi:hypothetical protein
MLLLFILQPLIQLFRHKKATTARIVMEVTESALKTVVWARDYALSPEGQTGAPPARPPLDPADPFFTLESLFENLRRDPKRFARLEENTPKALIERFYTVLWKRPPKIFTLFGALRGKDISAMQPRTARFIIVSGGARRASYILMRGYIL